jgi:hypothetical protein
MRAHHIATGRAYTGSHRRRDTLRERMSAPRIVAAALALVGCGNEPPPRELAADPPAPPAIVDAPPSEFPAARRCGEAGTTPTDLPPDVAAGRALLGTATLHEGDETKIGTTSLKWNPSAWIGSRGSGHRGAALVITIDQAEANGGAWGAHEEIVASRSSRLQIGPYRFDVRMSNAPVEVVVDVTRDACPGAKVIESTELPQSLWVSTDAITMQTFDSGAAMLQIALASHTLPPRLDVSTLGWRHWFQPVPDAPLRLRAGKYTVTIDEIVRSDADTLHARARIEANVPTPAASPRKPGVGCGAPTSTPTETPPSLTATPRVIEDLHLSVDEDALSGPIAMKLRREPSGEYLWLTFDTHPSMTPSMVSFAGEHTRARLARSATTLLRVDSSGVDELRVRRLKLECPHEIRIATIEAPTYLWLSTIGHGSVRIGTDSAPALALQLYPQLDSPSLSVTGAYSYYTPSILPTLVGDAFTLEGHVVEIVDVTSTGGTTFDRVWTTPNSVPAVHVQLRISRE